MADRIASGEAQVEYCPTGEMVADYFTKPLQGTLFRKFRDFIMNVDPLPTMTRLEDRRSVLELVPKGQDSEHDSNQDSTVLTHDGKSPGVTVRQAKDIWTTVDHGKGKRHRHRMLKKNILVARNE